MSDETTEQNIRSLKWFDSPAVLKWINQRENTHHTPAEVNELHQLQHEVTQQREHIHMLLKYCQEKEAELTESLGKLKESEIGCRELSRPAETNYGARGGPNMGLLYFYLYFTATINLNFVVYSIFNRRNIMQYLHNVWQYTYSQNPLIPPSSEYNTLSN